MDLLYYISIKITDTVPRIIQIICMRVSFSQNITTQRIVIATKFTMVKIIIAFERFSCLREYAQKPVPIV